MMSLHPLYGFEINMVVEFEFGCCKGGPSDGACPKAIAYMDYTIWKFLMLKKDIHPLYLRWFLLLQELSLRSVKMDD